ncbi:MAG: VWA domain-containing protein [Chloroflexia bacterium]|nr:VWA domain-containing protein [Chloroflexia bacterium]
MRTLAQVHRNLGKVSSAVLAFSILLLATTPRTNAGTTSQQQPSYGPPTIGHVTSTYHSGHPGIDLADTERSPIYPIGPGRVVYQGCEAGSYGWSVIIEHDQGSGNDKLWSRYAHMGARDQAGQCSDSYITQNLPLDVERDTQIGGQGNSGNVQGRTGIHLHLELRTGQDTFPGEDQWFNLTLVDPSDYIDHLEDREYVCLQGEQVGRGQPEWFPNQRLEILDFYRQNGSIVDFGCPLEDLQEEHNLLVQRFEGSGGVGRAIVWQPNDPGPMWMRTPILEAYLQDGGPGGSLGRIVSREYYFNNMLARRVDFEQGSLLQYGNTPIERLDATNGWLGEYFVLSPPADEDGGGPLLENPVFQRYDPDLGSYLAFEWGAGSPDPARIGSANGEADWFGARWTGRFTLSLPGLIRFFSWTDDGARLWVDDELIIDAWDARPAGERTETIFLAAGDHNLRFEVYETTGDASARMTWTRPPVLPVWADPAGPSIPEPAPALEPDGNDAGMFGGGPPQTNETSTVLLIDVSGSMDDSWQGGIKIESAKSAAIDTLNMIEQENQVSPGSHQVAIATFTTNAYLALPLTTDLNAARQTVNGLAPLQGTNIGAGLQVSNQALNSAPSGARKVIILLSDGLTNEGLTREQILTGPVQEAAAAGTCIYTVGFGDPGDLDEELLQNIAAGAACGEYNLAGAPIELERLYIRLRHQSLGQLLGEFNGEVAHGAQVNAGQVEVPPGQGELYASLFWPGSTLGLVLSDPQGQAVDQNYPGATVSTYSQLQYVVVDDPLPGAWQVAVTGDDVPQGTTWFDVVLSSRAAPPTPVPTFSPTPLPTATTVPPTPTAVATRPPMPTPTVAVGPSGSGAGPALIFLIGIVGGVALLVLVTTRRRALTATTGAPAQAGPQVVVRSGPQAGQLFRVGPQGLTIGRSRANDLQLAGREISRNHAVIKPAAGQYFIQDQGSAGGTYLNGQRVEAAPLRAGDLIHIGNVELEFRGS